MSFVLESGCKGIAFWLTNQIFSQKSCLKTYLFNTYLQLTQIELLIYLIKYTHAGAWVCACTYTQTTCMAGDAVHGTRILSFWTRILSSRTLILFFTNTNFIFFEHEFHSHWFFNVREDWRDEKNIYKPNFFVENRWYFYAQKWIFMQNKRRKCINIQNSGCKQNQGFYFLFSKISRVLFIIFVNNS